MYFLLHIPCLISSYIQLNTMKSKFMLILDMVNGERFESLKGKTTWTTIIFIFKIIQTGITRAKQSISDAISATRVETERKWDQLRAEMELSLQKISKFKIFGLMIFLPLQQQKILLPLSTGWIKHDISGNPFTTLSFSRYLLTLFQ